MLPRLLPACLAWLIAQTWVENSVSFVVSRNHRRTTARPDVHYLAAASQDRVIVVALTRQEGKNDKLKKALLAEPSLCGVKPVQVPCICHADGPDYNILESTLQDNEWTFVVVTSPQAAQVLISVWNKCHFVNEKPAVAAVGKATQAALEQAGITVAFCPSKATAATLVQELPFPESTTTSPRVLYPASVRAQKTLQEGLTNRGFQVTRLDTYDTVTAEWNDEQRDWAAQAKIACFASPSAVKGWLSNNSHDDKTVLAACIGETSAQACQEEGWPPESIFYPDKPGMEGWVQAVSNAMSTLRQGAPQHSG